MDLEYEMTLVIRELWRTHSDGAMARLMEKAWGRAVRPRRVAKLRKELGFTRPSDSVPRRRGRPPGGRLGPE